MNFSSRYTEVFLDEKPTNALVVQMYKSGCWTGWRFDRALMLGRYSIHRVTEVKPGTDRISLVLKYETQPGVFISEADRKLIYGPSAPGEPENPSLVATN